MIHVVSLVGYQGAGKSSIAQCLARLYGTTHIETSSVVQDMHKNLTRDELPQTAALTKREPNWLARILYGIIEEQQKDLAIISGVREPAVYNHLEECGAEIVSIEVRCPVFERYRRVQQLEKVFTAKQFIEHELDEIVMGLREMVEYSPFVVETSEETKPTLIAQAIKTKLAGKGIV